MSGWTLDDLPDQTGRTIVVTGVTSGLGALVARELVRRGARVVLAARNEQRLAETAASLEGDAAGPPVEQVVVDLADLGSVRRAAAQLAPLGPVDALVNNAGVMAVPYSRTVDNLELTMATNHFGPFLLTGLLLPQLVAGGDARVVTVSSVAHRLARTAPLDDPRTPPARYRRWAAYEQSKLANLLFTFELQRRLEAAGLPVRALAAHPGFAATPLLANGQVGRPRGGVASILNAFVAATAQSAEAGAVPILMAATADLPSGRFCGPTGFLDQRGPVSVTEAAPRAHDQVAQRRLWEISEDTVGLRYP